LTESDLYKPVSYYELTVSMDKRPSSEELLSSASLYLHQVLLDQRAATVELQANNRELAAILDEVVSVRSELRSVVPGNAEADSAAEEALPSIAKASQSKAASKDIDLAQLRRDADHARQAGQRAIRESALLRQKSERVRLALRAGAGGSNKPAPSDYGGLSRRERQVLSLIVEGKSTKQIAVELGISFKTAVTHRASLMGKLDVHEVASVVRVAILQGLA
jgi:DNA-binding NarL/FixJ family response regulator